MQTVSVIIPAYNAAPFIGRAIESALAQTLLPVEILVVDDGSTDGTAEVVSAYGPPVRLIAKRNGGPASARNVGCREARGQWLAMLDADDWWEPGKLLRQVALDTSDDIGLIHGPTSARPNQPFELTFEALWRHNAIVNSSVIIRRSVFQELGGFNEDRRLISAEDYNLWLRVAGAGYRVIACGAADALTHYRHGIGISSRTEPFCKALLYNAELIAREFNVPRDMVQARRLEIRDMMGLAALHHRQIQLARRLLGWAFLRSPTRARAIRLAAAYTPLGLLETRRRVLSNKRTAKLEQVPFEGKDRVKFPESRPTLLVIIDAEEEFDWRIVPSVSSGVTAMARQELAQRIFVRHGVVPTYAVDYMVASQEDGYRPLLPFLSDGTCEIGAHLHPWGNPPIEEELVEQNSFPGSLPAGLEFAKMKTLTEIICKRFGCRPILYRAGRYGMGPHTTHNLDRLGYKIDCSVLPLHDLRAKFGPNYWGSPNEPFWCGPSNNLLEIPVTVGITGLLGARGGSLPQVAFSHWGEALHLTGLLARTHLLDRIRLTPEGTSLDEAKRLTRTLVKRDARRVFVLSYHSPSLKPGNTPYVRNERELTKFLDWIDGYLEFFFGEIGGVPSTPGEVYRRAQRSCLDIGRELAVGE